MPKLSVRWNVSVFCQCVKGGNFPCFYCYAGSFPHNCYVSLKSEKHTMKEYVGKYWVALNAKIITWEKFFEAIHSYILEKNEPNIWIIELAAQENAKDFYSLKKYIEEFIYSNNFEFENFGYCLACYSEGIIDIVQMNTLLRKYFISEEYGHFECPNRELSDLYNGWHHYPPENIDEIFLSELRSILSHS